ncbi:MAG: DUF885 domain-containing protein [Candidatus Sericytochromatia bacterium]|nr:DUF885 domain-containing protein [Candidatus Sericytochromatia bacterium]
MTAANAVRRTLLAASLLALAGVGPGSPARAEAQEPAEALRRLLAREWAWSLAQDPPLASALGVRRWNDRWPDQTPTARAARLVHQRRVLQALDAFPVARLPAEARLDHALFRRAVTDWLAGQAVGEDLLAVTPLVGPQLDHMLVELLRFESERDHLDWLARLVSFPAHVEGAVTRLELGRQRGLVLERGLARQVEAQLARAAATPAEASPFLAPLRRLPADMSPARQAALRAEGLAAVRDGVRPALERLLAYWRGTYMPATPTRAGLGAVKGGAALYRHRLRVHTTLASPPSVLHARALAEVARLRREMDGVRRAVGFRGALPAFFKALGEDPRFRYPTRQRALAEHELLVRALERQVSRLFRAGGVAPCQVLPVPDVLGPGAPAAYYLPAALDGSRGGTFFVNLFDLARRPTYEMVPTALHEAVPGHHLQLSRQLARTDWPAFRRHARPTAFVEGWGLYAESLGEPLGLYRNPYARFGQLNMAMRRALRVVLDTGLHAGGWDREQATAFYAAHAARPRAVIAEEVERFLADPGQATAYKVGEWQLLALRERAREVLGARFDLRDFHEAVLRDGAVPLDVLEARLEAWLAGRARVREAWRPGRQEGS